MLALNPSPENIVTQPFPHLVIDRALPAKLFETLKASYPVCPPASGPTGFTIHRGDAEFDTVMAGSEAWRSFFEYCNSEKFVRSIAELFASEIDRSCSIDRKNIHFSDHIETRQEKEVSQIMHPALPPEAMFIRFDFMQGMKSYARKPHLDHRRRLATMLIYFDTPGSDTFEGGELVLHERSGAPASRIAPKANQAVFFPCSERSWHSVDAVTQCHSPRRFMQVSVSSTHDIWPDGKSGADKLVDWGKRAVRRLLPA